MMSGCSDFVAKGASVSEGLDEPVVEGLLGDLEAPVIGFLIWRFSSVAVQHSSRIPVTRRRVLDQLESSTQRGRCSRSRGFFVDCIGAAWEPCLSARYVS